MLKRKIETYLANWSKSEDRKPLVIKGIRQCGKTYIVQKFAKETYDNVGREGKILTNPLYMGFLVQDKLTDTVIPDIDLSSLITL